MIVKGDVINIVFCCDDRFAGPLQVAAMSAAVSTSSNVAIYVVDCGISPENKNTLQTWKGKFGNVTNVIFRKPPREKIFDAFPIAFHFSPAVFYRLAISRTFPELKRAIYMDCDVIIVDDIDLLWSVDLGEHPFGAVNEETNFFSSQDMVQRKAKVGIPPERTYMLSGVLLIDCKRFEEAKIFEKVLQFISGCKKLLPCPEQDAMNICLSPDEHLSLGPKFNFTPFAPLACRCLKNIKRPVIVHYSCYKPWNFNKKLVHTLCKLRLLRHSFRFIKEYWSYSDRVDEHTFSSSSTKQTWRFVYKRLFGGIEYFVAKKIRNGLIRLWRNRHGREKWTIKKSY
ncbi:MAG: glycosyltransferase family 8 protein [Puniceicoccales bacterium]|jgi:lipopolysaccharide biosynthesis glycosyltransferase|nr:glycosyltransferase family 8 protein [Puniceicoccales bacterium]